MAGGNAAFDFDYDKDGIANGMEWILGGNPTVNGLDMLLNQARPAFKAWFGVMPDITPELRRAVAATF